MRSYEEMKTDIGRVIEGLKSNTIDFDKAKMIVNCAKKLVKLDKLTIEEHKIRGEEPPDYLFSEKQIEDIELLIGHARKEIQNRNK